MNVNLLYSKIPSVSKSASVIDVNQQYGPKSMNVVNNPVPGPLVRIL
jgi:hypothetical protein